jgi:hypothetical protein
MVAGSGDAAISIASMSQEAWKRTSISVDLERAGEETRCDKAVENASGLIGQQRRESEHEKLFPALVTVDRGAGVRDERVVPRLLVKLQCPAA